MKKFDFSKEFGNIDPKYISEAEGEWKGKKKVWEPSFWSRLAAACVIFFYGTLRLRGILEGMQKIQNMIRINPVYLNTLLKMTGITYIAEFSSGICKDAGYGALGTQIEIFGKLSILAVSLPVILALLDTLQGLLA